MHYQKAKELFESQANLPKDEQEKLFASLWGKKKSFVTYFYSEFLNHLQSFPKKDSDQSYTEQKSKSNFLPDLIAYLHNFNMDLSGYDIEKFISSKESIVDLNPEQFSKILKSFLSLEYEAPRDPHEFKEHFKCLYLYYKIFEGHINKIPQSVIWRIDTVTGQLIARSLQAIFFMDNIGKTHDRVYESKKSIRKIKADRKQDVLEAYCKIQNRADRKPHQIASIIHDKLGEKAPSISTIKRYLEEDGLN